MYFNTLILKLKSFVIIGTAVAKCIVEIFITMENYSKSICSTCKFLNNCVLTLNKQFVITCSEHENKNDYRTVLAS